ncbi:hypothetical protein AHF37_07871 [Paragonimus kellicotti]|nr:hypothetical protein AHF37_07871 [Paragonimus kellicotti]
MSCHLESPSTPATPVSNAERRISDYDQATRSPSNADISPEADHQNMRVVESQTKGGNVSTQPSNIPDSVSGTTDKVSWRRLRDGDQELYVNQRTAEMTTKFRLFADASKRSQSFDSVSPTDGDAPASDDPEGSGRFALARIGKEHISGPLENKLVNFERRCMVHRTKFMQNDRRLPKRWSDALLLLSGPWLLFYKDAKLALPVSQLRLNHPDKFYRFSSSITGYV